MGKTNNHQANVSKARCAGLARSAGVARFYDTGVSKDSLRAADAADEIAEALAERAEKRRNAKEA